MEVLREPIKKNSSESKPAQSGFSRGNSPAQLVRLCLSLGTPCIPGACFETSAYIGFMLHTTTFNNTPTVIYRLSYVDERLFH